MYSKNYAPTTGVDFYLKRTTVAASRNCALKLWDISGKAMQGRMLDKYVFGEPNLTYSSHAQLNKSIMAYTSVYLADYESVVVSTVPYRG